MRRAQSGADFDNDVVAEGKVSLASDDPGDLEQRLKMMDTVGVEMQLLSVSATFPYLDQEQTARLTPRTRPMIRTPS